MPDFESIIELVRIGLIFYIGFVFSLCFSAWAEAFIADKVGDPGPRSHGRLTLNPLAHMDLMGTLVFPLFMFLFPLHGAGITIPFLGWCKPVELAGTRKISKRRYELYLSGTNLLAFLFLCLVMSGIALLLNIQGLSIWVVFIRFAQMNAALFLINLLPYPASSGSYFLKYLLRMDEATFYSLARWRLLVFIILINIPQFRWFLGWASATITESFVSLFATFLG